MKRLLTLAALGAFILNTASCSKDDDTAQAVAPVGKVQVAFTNTVGTEPVVLGPLRYVNAAGNRYSADLLKYYVSHFTLIREDNSEVVSAGHELIDQADSASRHFTLDSIPNGRYNRVRFYLGVDYDHNHTGAQEGDLDPIHGMIWTWATGYMFFKHEGSYMDAASATKQLAFHYGTDKALATVTLDIPPVEVKGNSRKINLRFDLNALYDGRSRIDFNVDNNRMSTSRDDAMWITSMQDNIPGAFSFTSAE